MYDKAAQEWKEKNGSDEEKLRPFSVPDPPLAALGRRDEWLARECPATPVALRAAHLKSDTEPNDADSLRARVSAYLDQRVTPPPQDPYLSPRSRKRPLYNQVVRIIDKPPCYEAKYWFVYQYAFPRVEVWRRLHFPDTTRLQEFGRDARDTRRAGTSLTWSSAIYVRWRLMDSLIAIPPERAGLVGG